MPICAGKTVLQFPIDKLFFQLDYFALLTTLIQGPLSYGERHGRQSRGLGMAPPTISRRRRFGLIGST